MIKTELKAISFDIDHTLIDFDVVLQRSLLKVSDAIFEAYGLRLTVEALQAEREQVSEQFDPNTDFLTTRRESFITILKKHNLSSDRVDELVALFIAERFKNVPFMPNAIGMLEALPKGLKIAALSNGNSDPRRLGFGQYFDCLLLEDDLPFKKPDRRAFDALMQATKISDPSQILHVGDNFETDVIGADRAGLLTIWYNPSQLPASQMIAAHEIHDLKDIPEILKAHYQIKHDLP